VLSSYLNQRAYLQRAEGTDERGQPIFGPAQAVRCRKQRRGRIVAVNNSATRVQETVYFLLASVAEGDKLDGMLVKSVDDWADLRGDNAGCKAVV